MVPIVNPALAVYLVNHVYSKAPEAEKKLALDLKFVGPDFRRASEVDLANEGYLKYLIDAASQGKVRVGTSTKLQFFIIRGGGEGFLPQSLRGVDASNVTYSTTSTSGTSSTDSVVDYNDVLAVFDKTGRLISSALLERPLFIRGIWSKRTANKVYDSWANREVFIYRNDNFSIEYLGLGVRDEYRGKRATIDLHKQEHTNGCIFIVDRATPALGDEAALGKFEPQLIKDVLKQAGIDLNSVGHRGITIGRMKLVTIR